MPCSVTRCAGAPRDALLGWGVALSASGDSAGAASALAAASAARPGHAQALVALAAALRAAGRGGGARCEMRAAAMAATHHATELAAMEAAAEAGGDAGGRAGSARRTDDWSTALAGPLCCQNVAPVRKVKFLKSYLLARARQRCVLSVVQIQQLFA